MSVLPCQRNPVLDLHVGGVLVRELPIEMQGRTLYQQTDEGIDENNQGKSEHQVLVGAEGFGKALQQRRDELKEREMEPYEARDPLKEAADQYAQPGLRAKFLSQRKVKENGGTGDYQVVKDAKRDPVSIRGMILGHIPEERAKARNRHYQGRSRKLLGEITERYKQEGGKMAVADQ